MIKVTVNRHFEKKMFGQCCTLIENNLIEMELIANQLSCSEFTAECDKRRLLFLGSHLYDYYLLVEDCLLNIAKLTDKWVPASLDWRYRLVDLMQIPLEEKRPPVISGESANLLKDFLVLFLNYHHHSANFSPARIGKMISVIDTLNSLLGREFKQIIRLLSLR